MHHVTLAGSFLHGRWLDSVEAAAAAPVLILTSKFLSGLIGSDHSDFIFV